MGPRSIFRLGAVGLSLAFNSLTLYAADKSPSNGKELPEAVQPAVESLDLTMYSRIREEGLLHSHIMEYASALMDDIGPRLTGSPNMAKANAWTRDQLTAMGCVNAHLEDWGEFGMGWQQLNTWVRMTAPDTAVFIAQAAPWSPATKGVISGAAVSVEIQTDADFAQYKGKLAGKIALLGEPGPARLGDKPLFTREEDASLEKMKAFPLDDPDAEFDVEVKQYLGRIAFRGKIAKFLDDEKVVAILIPSGSGGTIFDDSGMGLNWFAYQREHVAPMPVVVTASETFGRALRLLHANVPVSLELNVDTKFTGDHEHGFDTVAEIAGTDPRLKQELVMVGGHLDSWASGTGATDNGAGSVIAIEVMRILKALNVQPRRTIRIALWSGEEEGLFGSYGYVKQHFGSFTRASDASVADLPEFVRRAVGPVILKPDQSRVSAYFNVDNGGGKLRGIYTQGNAAIAPIFIQWIAPLRDLGVSTVTLRSTGGTDHLAFDEVGIPGFQFIQDPLDYETRTHHSNMDTYERLQPEDMKQAAVVEATFVYNAAMRDQMLPRKPLPHPELRQKQMAPLSDLFPGAVAP